MVFESSALVLLQAKELDQTLETKRTLGSGTGFESSALVLLQGNEIDQTLETKGSTTEWMQHST